MKTSSVKCKDQAFWASCTPPRRVRLLVKVEFPLSFELVFMNDNIKKLQNLFTIGIETPFRLSFQNSLEKTKCYCNISVGLINRTAKNTG